MDNMDNNTTPDLNPVSMPHPKHPLCQNLINQKGKRAGRRKKSTSNQKSLAKGFFLIKKIVNKAIINSRLSYCVVWDVGKGSKHQWIDFTNLGTALHLMKNFDYKFRNDPAQYARFAVKYVTRKISSVEVASQQKVLEGNEKVMRIVAYEPSTHTVVIFWENGCISAVNLKTVTDVGLKMAIGSTLFRENHWILDYHVEKLTGVKGVSLWEGEHITSLEEESVDWEAFYEKTFDNFAGNVSKYWSIVEERSPVLIFNPSFPAENIEDEERPKNLIIVSHCICSNCGRVYDQPKVDLVEHILVTGHIGWYSVCLVEKETLESLAKNRKKGRKKGIKNSKPVYPVAPVSTVRTASLRSAVKKDPNNDI